MQGRRRETKQKTGWSLKTTTVKLENSLEKLSTK